MLYLCSTGWTVELGDMLLSLSGQVDGIGPCFSPAKEKGGHGGLHYARMNSSVPRVLVRQDDEICDGARFLYWPQLQLFWLLLHSQEPNQQPMVARDRRDVSGLQNGGQWHATAMSAGE